ncbi:MAG: stage II sporulation protein R [Clostridiales bacterium]|nr:stage II sporulation protein R [Clostridiales bacterium]
MSTINFHKKSICTFFFILILITTAFITYAKNVEKNLSEKFLRLHIIANSNSKEDQELKIKIRDKILDETKKWFITCKNANDSLEIINKNIDKISEITKEEIKKEGYCYDIQAVIGNFLFPTKSYKNIILPAGKYKALKIKIGDAKGENWWCVLFPPLCFINGFDTKLPLEEENQLKTNISENQYELITENEEISTIKIKFKIIELLAPLFIKKN